VEKPDLKEIGQAEKQIKAAPLKMNIFVQHIT